MTSSQQPEDLIAAPPPTILVEEVESDSPKESERTQGEKTPQSSPIRSSRLQVPETRPRRSTRKRTASQISDTEAASFEPADAMSSQTSKHKSEGGSKKHHGSSSKKDRKSSKSDDWSEVTEPEERRRIQNRIAQRKFREKTRETKARSEREQRNQDLAGSSYQIPTSDDLAANQEHSGLPWGGIDMRHVVGRGHEDQSRRSSSRGEYVQDETGRYLSSHVGGYSGSRTRSSTIGYQQANYGSGEEHYEGESPGDFTFDYDVHLDSRQGQHYRR